MIEYNQNKNLISAVKFFFHKLDYKKEVKNFLLLIIGSYLSAVAINVFYLPFYFTMGGISGIASIINYAIGSDFIGIGALTFILNIPIFYLSYREFDLNFTIRSLIGTMVFSIAVDHGATFMNSWVEVLTKDILNFRPDLTIFAITGGIIFGIGLGIIFMAGYTTGGADILCFVAKKYIKNLSLGSIVYIFDFIIIAATLFVFDSEKTGSPFILAIYSIISLLVVAKAIDMVLEGINMIRVAFIISDKSDEIAAKILYELERGCTGLKSTGLYSKKDRNTLFCVLPIKEINQLKKIVADIDDKAFIIVSHAHEVLGEGFEKTI